MVSSRSATIVIAYLKIYENKTFNDVLMRRINTSLTSAIPIISIIVIGNYLGIEGNLADFAIPLLIGIVSGTYSSIFVTVPFLSKIIKTN